jgi:hypothetical protein
LHHNGNAADGRRHFGAHLRAAQLKDDAVRILPLNATGFDLNAKGVLEIPCAQSFSNPVSPVGVYLQGYRKTAPLTY